MSSLVLTERDIDRFTVQTPLPCPTSRLPTERLAILRDTLAAKAGVRIVQFLTGRDGLEVDLDWIEIYDLSNYNHQTFQGEANVLKLVVVFRECDAD